MKAEKKLRQFCSEDRENTGALPRKDTGAADPPERRICGASLRAILHAAAWVLLSDCPSRVRVTVFSV